MLYIMAAIVYMKNYLKSLEKAAIVLNYRSFCIKIFKTLNDVNSTFVKDIFKPRITNLLVREQYKLNLEIIKSNQVKFELKYLRYLGPKVWTYLPYHIKFSEILTIFKALIK